MFDTNTLLLNLFTQFVVPALGTVIMSLGTYGAFLITKKLKNEQVKQAMQMLTMVAESTVFSLNQTLVPTLRDVNGELSTENKQAVKNKAIVLIKSQMQSGLLDLLEKNGIDVEAMIRTEIESHVFIAKIENGKI